MSSNNIIQEMGIKDLEHVVLKARDYVTLGDKTFKPGETVLYFRNIQIAWLSEDTRVVAARGGFLNQPRVIWEDRSDTTFQFSNGTLNPLSLNLLLEANAFREEEKICIPYQELVPREHITITKEGEDDFCSFTLKYKCASNKKNFFYTFFAENLQETLDPKSVKKIDKIDPLTQKLRTTIMAKLPPSWKKMEDYNDCGIMADYYFVPEKNPLVYSMDRERKPNLYTLEATFYLKDENDGLLHTGILEMPKVYIKSNINLRMGERADPTVGTFRIVAMPENYDGYESVVWRMMYLDDDIYGI